MTTRVALVGAGSVARRHVQVLTSLPGVEVVAVSDPLPEAAEGLARDCGATPFADVEEALNACDADAVYICVPPFAHGQPERAVLARGLPMFVEKPVAADLTTAERLAAMVEESGVVTGTGYHWRCLDTLAHARWLLADSTPWLASGYWLDKRPPVPWWSRVDKSGGQVVEQLTHVLDVARALLGEAVEVFAAGTRQHPPDGAEPDRGDVDDATAATVRFASGTVATLAATSLLNTKRRAALHTFSRGLVLELCETDLLVDDGDGGHRHEPAEDPRITVDREFIEAVRGQRETTRTPYAEAVRTHRLGCAVAQSARTGQPVRLPAEPAGDA